MAETTKKNDDCGWTTVSTRMKPKDRRRFARAAKKRGYRTPSAFLKHLAQAAMEREGV